MIIEHNIVQDVRLAQRGDSEAFSRLILANERKLYRMARMYLKRDEDCADAMQETIYKSFRAIQTLKEPAYFKTWLFRILIHECIQMLRLQKRSPIVEQAAWDRKAVNVPYEVIELKEAVANLEDDLRIVIQLHYFEEIPVKQIARRIGVPEGTVKSRLHRARTCLAERLELSNGRRRDYDPTLRQEGCRGNAILLPSIFRKRIDKALSAVSRKRNIGNDGLTVANSDPRFCL